MHLIDCRPSPTRIVVVLLLCLALATSAAGDEPLRIAVVAPQKGPLADFGRPVVAAVERLVGDLNADGGLAGRRIELIVEDDACCPDTAGAVARTLVARQPVAVIGHLCNEATREALKTYRTAGMLVISPGADAVALTGEARYQRFFRTVGPADAEARKVADFVLEAGGLERIVIWHTAGDYFVRQAETTRRRIEAAGGVRVAALAPLPQAPADFKALAVKPLPAGNAGIVLWADGETARGVLERLRDLKPKATLVIAGIGRSDGIDELARLSAGPLYCCVPHALLEYSRAASARQAYLEMVGKEPPIFFYLAHAAATALFQAIAAADDPRDPAALTRQLHRLSFDTAIGTIRFDDQGDVVGDFHTIVTPGAGAFETVF